MVITLYQIHSRLVDETMRGSYNYAPLKLLLCKVVKDSVANPNSKNPEANVVAFIDGDYVQYNHTHIELPSISPGEYVVFVLGEWEALNPHRKLILNVYAPDPLPITRVATNENLKSVFNRMDMLLNQRLNQGPAYKIPQFALKQ